MHFHGNSNENPNPHHLYAIFDKELDDLFKFGISHDTIDSDGLSDRPRNQIRFLNLAVGWPRYFVKILLRDIQGRRAAKEIEDRFIAEFAEKHGQNPRGNLD